MNLLILVLLLPLLLVFTLLLPLLLLYYCHCYHYRYYLGSINTILTDTSAIAATTTNAFTDPTATTTTTATYIRPTTAQNAATITTCHKYCYAYHSCYYCCCRHQNHLLHATLRRVRRPPVVPICPAVQYSLHVASHSTCPIRSSS